MIIDGSLYFKCIEELPQAFLLATNLRKNFTQFFQKNILLQMFANFVKFDHTPKESLPDLDRFGGSVRQIIYCFDVFQKLVTIMLYPFWDDHHWRNVTKIILKSSLSAARVNQQPPMHQPVGRFVHWMGCVFSSEVKWGSYSPFLFLLTTIFFFRSLFCAVFYWI
jgi:hypothetical protein